MVIIRNMRNEKIKIKIRNTARFLIAMLLIMISLFIMLPNYMKHSEDTISSVKNEIKTSWEEKTENYLELIRTDLQTSVNNGELKTGAAVANAKVEAVVVLDGTGVNRARKVVIYKKRRRKDSKLKRGFRKSFTKVRITKIAA